MTKQMRIRRDLQEKGFGVPIGDGDAFFYGNDPVDARWLGETDDDDGQFQIFHPELKQWVNAVSIDFEDAE